MACGTTGKNGILSVIGLEAARGGKARVKAYDCKSHRASKKAAAAALVAILLYRQSIIFLFNWVKLECRNFD
jgi:hypothetical protein